MVTQTFGKVKHASAATVNDGLMNVVANLGTARDKASHSQYVAQWFQPNELREMFRSSWLARSIVEYPAEDATRKWRAWRAQPAQITLIEQLEKRLGLQEKVEAAITQARLFGGSALYINTRDPDQAAPLVIPSEIRSLVLLSRSMLNPGPIVRDIDSDYFGEPEFYTLSSGEKQVTIHRTRLVLFRGAGVPGGAEIGQAWDDSVLQSTYAAVTQVDSTMANMASLVFEAKVDVFKFKGLAELFENKQDALLMSRLSAQAAMKGINGAVTIDSEDDYEQKSASFAGLPEVVTKFMDAVAGASRIPVTRLYGRAAVGLSGSGDGDERVYFDRIGHLQATQISPAMHDLDECLIYQALGSRPPEVWYEWRPLRQLTENERADILSKIATAARTLAGANAGEVMGLDVIEAGTINSIIELGAMPGIEAAVEKFGTLAEQGLGDDNDPVQ